MMVGGWDNGGWCVPRVMVKGEVVGMCENDVNLLNSIKIF